MENTMFRLLLISLIAVSTACANTFPMNSDLAGSPTKSATVYIFESDASGFNTKTVFYDTGYEVIAFDTQFTEELAKQSIDFIRSKTKNPLTYAVLTHPNPDKFNGLKTYQAVGAKVVASSSTKAAMPGVHKYKKNFFVSVAAMFEESAYPVLGVPDQTFDKRLTLKLKGNKSVELYEFNRPGVSTNQTIAYLKDVNQLVVGDLIHHKAHAWLEGGIVAGSPRPKVSEWISLLEDMQKMFNARNPLVQGGRGESATLTEAVPQQVSYLKAVDQIVEAYVSEVDSTDFAKDLEVLISREYPSYKLPYMIQYGIYGLVGQKK
jgi:glyoxylase-like metal-dependent hydrolase (beta-lactamase superfamily II)